jgi:hypothetical protein
LGGYTYSYGNDGNAAAWFVRVDSNGMTLWNQTYGAANDYFGYGVTETSKGYALSGVVEPADGKKL